MAREKNKETILNYEQSYLQAMNDVETALSDVQNYRQQTVALKATIGAVQHSYDLSQQLYRLGQVSYLNVLDAERTLFDAQMKLCRRRWAPIWAVMRHYTKRSGAAGLPPKSCYRLSRPGIPSNRTRLNHIRMYLDQIIPHYWTSPTA